MEHRLAIWRACPAVALVVVSMLLLGCSGGDDHSLGARLGAWMQTTCPQDITRVDHQGRSFSPHTLGKSFAKVTRQRALDVGSVSCEPDGAGPAMAIVVYPSRTVMLKAARGYTGGSLCLLKRTMFTLDHERPRAWTQLCRSLSGNLSQQRRRVDRSA